MTSEQFAYWLQGFAELNPSIEAPSPEQWKAIQDHLKTVFVKVTPQIGVQPAPMPRLPTYFDPAWQYQTLVTC